MVALSPAGPVSPVKKAGFLVRQKLIFDGLGFGGSGAGLPRRCQNLL